MGPELGGTGEYGDALAVVVVRPPGAGLGRFLATLERATARPVPVVVADTDPTGGPEPAGATVVGIGEDVGHGAAANRAVAALDRGVGLVAVARAGTEWADGALDALVAAAARHPRAGVLAPAVRDPGGRLRPSAHPLPRPGWAAALRGGTWPDAGPAAPPEGPVGWSSAPCVLLRRVAFDGVDGYDPRYVRHLGELDLGDRLARAGWLTVHVPSAVVVRAAAPADPADLARGTRRYLADRASRPLRALLRVRAPRPDPTVLAG